MAIVYIIRHGQANSLGANYDQLTDHGHLQARRVGEYFSRMNTSFDYVASGSLKRQIQTLEGILKPMEEKGLRITDSKIHEGLNEFEGKMWKEIALNIAKIDNHYKETLAEYRSLQEAGDPKCRKIFPFIIQRILKEWVEGEHSDVFPFAEYHKKVVSVLDELPDTKESILLTTSATPVSIFAGYSLDLDFKDYFSFMKYISNTSFNVFHWVDRKLSPITINSYPHIQSPEEFTEL